MGYYLRILGKRNPSIPLDLIKGRIQNFKNAKVRIDEGNDLDWSLISTILDDSDIMQIEKNPVYLDGLGKQELDEFKEEILSCKPDSAVEWLISYFNKVKIIYAFQILDFSESEGWNLIGEIKDLFMDVTNGIIQADYEGFTNEEGYHILWQFSDNVSGHWNMAVLNNNKWTKFKMDLGNLKQREAFLTGRIPENVELII